MHTGLLAYSAYVHSPTLNEPGHLVAGLSHWKFGRFEVYRVNPPLVKMIAALPVMAVGYNEDWSRFYEGLGARPEMAMGEDFIAANGERSLFLFMIARWACIPFSWIGAITCYLWGRDLYGRPAGVMACTVWCFEPNMLAHASLMTPDVGGTAFGVATCYTFWNWLKNPSWTQTTITGAVLGLAELCKTTLIVLYPLWPVLWVVYRWPNRLKLTAHDWLREAGMLALRMVIGLYVLNLGYGFEGTGIRLNEFHFVSNLFNGEKSLPFQEAPRLASADNPQSKFRSPSSDNRFANSFLGALPIPVPKNYLMGIDIQQKDFEDYGRPSYLRGKWQKSGWWYYYIYATLIKVPLGLWFLGGLTVLLRASGKDHLNFSETGREKRRSALDTFILLTPPLVIFCVVSGKTGFSEHFRYILPSFPFLFIWLSQTTRTIVKMA